ncbi:hypothetical protein F8M41_006796 [Gigaspora margarita]|uniref:SWIM-type domain-containing protein n=1 Tax=Gigaspora margarita TaxID=4874 RepID=A0A8H3X5U9_GIGMA|nr:hypothetical protein F8M41_006796 [Gigaspora margarita]
MRAVKTLEIPLKKLPTANNHHEKMNEYLKNNQLKQFQRNNHPLRADVLYIVLVYEVIPNILTLRNLAESLEHEKVESETMPNLVYTTCVYSEPMNICCQCPDFLQKGIICKHLHATALYIDNLRQQEQHAHLSEMVFATYQEARDIKLKEEILMIIVLMILMMTKI